MVSLVVYRQQQRRRETGQESITGKVGISCFKGRVKGMQGISQDAGGGGGGASLVSVHMPREAKRQIKNNCTLKEEDRP